MTKKGIKTAIESILEAHRIPMDIENIINHMVKRSRGRKSKSAVKKEVVDALKEGVFEEKYGKLNGKIYLNKKRNPTGSNSDEEIESTAISSIDVCVSDSSDEAFDGHKRGYKKCSNCAILLKKKASCKQRRYKGAKGKRSQSAVDVFLTESLYDEAIAANKRRQEFNSKQLRMAYMPEPVKRYKANKGGKLYYKVRSDHNIKPKNRTSSKAKKFLKDCRDLIIPNMFNLYERQEFNAICDSYEQAEPNNFASHEQSKLAIPSPCEQPEITAEHDKGKQTDLINSDIRVSGELSNSKQSEINAKQDRDVQAQASDLPEFDSSAKCNECHSKE